MTARVQRHLFPFCVPLVAASGAVAPATTLAQRSDPAPVIAADHLLSARATNGIDALAAGSTPDVVFLYPNAQLLRGRDDVRRLLDSVAATTHDRLRWSPVRTELSSDGSRAYSYGRGTRTEQIDGRDSVSGIRYVAWWRRDTSGKWRTAAWLLIDERGTPSSTEWPCTTPATIARFADSTTGGDVIGADSAFAARAASAGPPVAFAEYVASDGVSLGASSPTPGTPRPPG